MLNARDIINLSRFSAIYTISNLEDQKHRTDIMAIFFHIIYMQNSINEKSRKIVK